MPFNFTVSPDFAPDHMSGWFYFNTWLQRQLGIEMHLELYDNFEDQRADIRAGKVDLIYAQPLRCLHAGPRNWDSRPLHAPCENGTRP